MWQLRAGEVTLAGGTVRMRTPDTWSALLETGPGRIEIVLVGDAECRFRLWASSWYRGEEGRELCEVAERQSGAGAGGPPGQASRGPGGLGAGGGVEQLIVFGRAWDRGEVFTLREVLGVLVPFIRLATGRELHVAWDLASQDSQSGPQRALAEAIATSQEEERGEAPERYRFCWATAGERGVLLMLRHLEEDRQEADEVWAKVVESVSIEATPETAEA
jgi:hypothetical protein